jgi:hypothetical protein
MIVLRIEHAVTSFEGWKKAFDSDPIDRKGSAVLNYQIFRPVDDPNFVMLDLAFEHLQEAEAVLAQLRNLWNKVEGKIIMKPQTRILELAESIQV